jgi:surface protein
MFGMFRGASSFNQNLSSWNVSSVTDMRRMFDSSGMSAKSYDRTLIGWSRLDLTSGVSFGASGIEYCDAGPFRTYLQGEFGWTIGDAGQSSGCPSDLASSGNTSVSSSGSVSFTTGTRIAFDLSSGSGEVALGRFSDVPKSVSGISESNVSDYRVVVVAGPDLSLNSTTEVRFKVSEFPGIDAPSDVTVYSRPIPSTGDFSALTTSVDENGTSGDTSDDEIVAETGSFSELVFASDSSPLPVELARFKGTAVEPGETAGTGEATVRLTWQTASETNNAGFEVQRKAGSGGASAWKEVGYRESKANGGTTNQPLTYRFTDGQVPYSADSVSYRLRQVDTDGTSSYSEARTVELKGPDGVTLQAPFPNPARGSVTLRFALPEPTDVTIEVYDVMGRKVKTLRHGTEKAGPKETEMPTDRLSAGMYFIRLQTEDRVRTTRFTVVK